MNQGPALVCNLSLDCVRKAVTLADQKLAGAEDSHVSKLVTETAQRAAELTKLIAQPGASASIAPGTLHKSHQQVPAMSKKKKNVDLPPVTSETSH